MESDYGIPRDLSALQKMRAQYQPGLPPCLQGNHVTVVYSDGAKTADSHSADVISRAFPHTFGQPLAHFLSAVSDSHSITENPVTRVGVVFCGRQSPGGHNVIWGLHNAIKSHNPESILLGFLGGTKGLFAKKTLEITDVILSTYKNQGGYDLLGRAKDQIKTTEQFKAAMLACEALKLNSLVIIGGITSNSDAAYLAETFAEMKCATRVVGVPVTSNGDFKNQFVETDVGFDTVCRVNSQLISNVCLDALSAEKYYHFIRLMDHRSSHIAVECALQSHPNIVLLGEEVAISNFTLLDIAKQISGAVQSRADQGKYHGVILIPEGLIECIPELRALVQEIHNLQQKGIINENISSFLSNKASTLFESLPSSIRGQLLLLPESDNSSQLSQIETERLIAQLVEKEINKRMKEGVYKGKKFNAICHFFGYQTRGSLPSNFDCDYAYVLGHICYHIIAARLNGYTAIATNLKYPMNQWGCGAVPITAMMTIKQVSKDLEPLTYGKPALHPAKIDLNGELYKMLKKKAPSFLMDDLYRNPGPLQFDGPGANTKLYTVSVENHDQINGFDKENSYLSEQGSAYITIPITYFVFHTHTNIQFDDTFLVLQVSSTVKPEYTQNTVKAEMKYQVFHMDIN